jgi:hypothetical protein
MTCWRLIVLLPLLLICGCNDSSKSDIKQWEIDSDWIEKGPVKARLKLAKKNLSILEDQHMILEIQGPPDIDIETPSLDQRLGDYQSVPWRADTYDKDENSQTILKYFALNRLESGEQVVPPIEVRYHQSSGNQSISTSLKLPAQYFNFTPIQDMALVEKNLEKPLGLANLKPFPWVKVVLIFLGVVVTILLLIFIIDYLKKKPKEKPAPPPIPAHILAWRELEALVKQHKSGDLSPELFVSELCNVLRRYIERRFELKAPELTTEEFLNLLIKDGGELKSQQTVLKQFLEFTDLVKFANQKVQDEDVEKGFAFIKTFIQQSKLEETT